MESEEQCLNIQLTLIPEVTTSACCASLRTYEQSRCHSVLGLSGLHACSWSIQLATLRNSLSMASTYSGLLENLPSANYLSLQPKHVALSVVRKTELASIAIDGA
jgi:hypothetical protein